MAVLVGAFGWPVGGAVTTIESLPQLSVLVTLAPLWVFVH
jgi:hypothetical protein